MVKNCAHGLCNSCSRYADRPYMKNVTFFPFPKPTVDPEKCARWLDACNREDLAVSQINRATYVCSKHFHGGKGPTWDHPDPIQATSLEYPVVNNRTRKKLRPDPKPSQEQVFKTEENVTGSSETIVPDQLHPVKSFTVHPVTLHPIKPSTVKPDQPSNVCPAKPSTVRSVKQSTGQSSKRWTVHPLKLVTANSAGTNESQDDVIRFEEILPTESPTLHVAPSSSEAYSTNFEDVPVPDNCLFPEIFYKELVSQLVPDNWAFLYGNQELTFIKVESNTVLMSLKLDRELKLSLKIFGEELNRNHEIYSNLSVAGLSSVHDVLKLLCILDDWMVCQGTNNKLHIDFFLKNGTFPGCRLVLQTMSLHSLQCSVVLPWNGQRKSCSKCSLLKHSLAAVIRRREIMRKKSVLSNKCNARYLPKEGLLQRLRDSNKKLKTYVRMIRSLEKKLQKSILKSDF